MKTKRSKNILLRQSKPERKEAQMQSNLFYHIIKPMLLALVFLFLGVVAKAQTQTFATTGTSTFTVPAGVTSVTVECWGAGGGGGYGGGTNKYGGGGGGGGGYSKSTGVAVNPCGTYTIVVGTGGSAGTAGTQDGGVGGSSYAVFGSTITANGGNGGASYTNGRAGGTGGTGTDFNGGNGGTGLTTGSGGGGGCAGATSIGGNGAVPGAGTAGSGSAGISGAGGVGSTANAAVGTAGNNYGGGGGGGTKNSNGAAGAGGYVKISWTVPASITYYSTGSVDPAVTSNWKSNTDGTGYSPCNFTDNNQIFIIQSGHTMTTTSNWAVGGTGSKLQISSGGILVANNAITLAASVTFQIDNGGTYRQNHNTNNNIFAGTNSFGATSTVEFVFSGVQTVFATTYGNLTLGGTSAKTTTGVTVNGVLSMEGDGSVSVSAALTYGASATLQYKGTGAKVTGLEFPASWTGSGGVKIENASGVTLGAAKNLNANSLTIGGTVANSILNDGGFQITCTGTLNLSSGTFILGSVASATTWPAFGTINITAGTYVEYASGVAQSVSASPSYQNLTFSGAGTKTTAAGTLTIAGNLSITGGNILLSTNNTAVSLTGNLTLNSGFVFLGTGNFSFGTSSTVGGSPSATAMIVADAALSTGTVVKSFAADDTPAFTFPIGDNTGSAEYSPVTIDFSSTSGASGTVGVIVTDASHPSLGAPADYLTRYWTFTTTGIATYSYSSIFTYTAADIVGTESSIVLNYWNGSAWSVDQSSYTSSYQLISSSLTETTGALNGNAYTGMTLAATKYFRSVATGDWSNIATWEFSDDQVAWSAATMAPTATNSLGISILSGHVVTATANTSGDQMSIATGGGKLIVNSGVTFTISNGAEATDCDVSGTIENYGTISSVGTLAFNAGALYNHKRDGGAIPVATWNTTSNCWVTGITNTAITPISANTTFGNFRWNCSAQVVSCDLASGAVNVNIAGNFQIFSGTLNLGTANLTVTGSTTVQGASSTLADDNASGTNIFTGLVNIKTSSTWNFSAAVPVELRGGLTFSGGSFVSGSGQYSFTTNNQNLTATSAMSFTGNILISGAIDLTVADVGGITVSGTIDGDNASSKLINNGTINYANNQQPMNTGILDASAVGNLFNYNGSGSQAVKVPSSTNYYNLKVSGTGTASLQGNISVLGDLTVLSGTFDLQSFTADRSSVGGTLSIGASGTLKIGGTGTFPLNYTTETLSAYVDVSNVGATVEYSGTNQNVKVRTYINLILSGSGSKTLSGGSDLTVSRLLTISGTASLNMGTGTLSGGADTGGGLTMTGGTLTLAKLATTLPEMGGTYSLTGGTVVFSGATQIMRSVTYSSVTISGGGTCTAGGNLTVNGTLTLTNGILYLGNYDLTIGTTGTISGSFDAAHMISCTGTGRLQKQFTGTTLNFTFPVGTGVVYTPAAINITSCTNGGTGNVLLRSVDSKEPNQINDTYSLSKYWAVTSTNISNINATLTYYYDESEVHAASEASYIGAYYPTGGPWVTSGVVNAGANTISFSVTGLSNLDANWTAGLNSAFVSTTYYTRTNGNWEDVTTWSTSACGGAAATSIPSASDNVILCNGFDVTINSAAVCGSLTIGNTANVTSLTIAGTNSLAVSGNLVFNQNANGNTYELNVYAGTCTVAGTVTGSAAGAMVVNVTTGNISFTRAIGMTWANRVNVSVTGSGTASWTGPLTYSNANTTLSVIGADGRLTFGGLVTQSAGTINSGARPGGGGTGSDGICSVINFNGGITMNNAGGLTTSAMDTIRFGGNLTNSTGSAFSFFSSNNGISTQVFNANAPTITSGAGMTFGDFILESAVTVTLSGDIVVTGDWINNSGFLTGGANTVIFDAPRAQTQYINGTSSTSFPNLLFRNGSIYVMEIDNSCNNLTFRYNTRNRANSLTHGDGLPVLTVAGNVSIYQPDNGGGGALTNGWYINVGSATVAGTLTLYDVGNATTKATKCEVTSGSLVVNGAVTYPVQATDAVHTITCTGSGSITFNSTVGSNGTPTILSDGVLSVTDAGTITFNQKFSMTGGTVSVASGGTLMFNKSGDAFSYGTGSVPTFTTSAGSILKFNGNITTTSALTFANESETYFIGDATITPVSLTFGNITLNIGADITLAGSISLTNDWNCNGGSIIPGANAVTFSGTTSQTITNSSGTETFYDLTSNTTGPVILEANTDLIITNQLSMTAGSFDLNGRTLQLGNGFVNYLSRTSGIIYNGYFKRYIVGGSAVSSTGVPYNGLFPIGIVTDYRPIEINSTISPTSSGYITVSHDDISSVIDVNYTDINGNAVQRVTDMRSTLLSSGGFGGGQYNLDITFTSLSTVGTTLTNLLMETQDGPPYGVGSTAPTTGTFASPTVKRTGLAADDLNHSFVIGTLNSTTEPLRKFYYSRRSGNWDDNTAGNSTWSYESGGSGTSCDCIPAIDGIFIVNPGHVITVNNPTTADYVDILTGGSIVGTQNFTVVRDLTTAGTGSFAPTAGTWSINRHLTLVGSGICSSTGALNVGGDLNVGAGTSLTLGTNSTMSGNVVIDGTLNIGATTLTLNGTNKNISGSAGSALIDGTGTVNITTGNKTVLIGSTLSVNPILSITGVITVTSYGSVTVNNNLTGSLAGSTWTNAANSTLAVTGVLLATGTLNASAVPNTVHYNGGGNQNIKSPAANYYYLKLSNAGTKTLPAANITVSGALTIQDAAILSDNGVRVLGVGDLNMSGTSEYIITTNGTEPSLTGTYSLDGGTITYNRNGNQTVRSIDPYGYYNLNFANGGTKTLAGNILIKNNMVISGNARLDVSTSVFLIEIRGNWNVTGTNGDPFIQRTGSVLFSGNAPQSISTGRVTGEDFYNLEFSNTLGVSLNAALVSLNVLNNLTINSLAVVDANGRPVVITGNWINNGGTFTPTGNTVTFNGNTQSLTSITTETFYNLSLINNSITTLFCPIDVDANLSVANNASLDVSSSNYQIYLGGNWNFSSTNLSSFVENSGTVTFNGAGVQNILTAQANETFYKVIISNNGGGVLLNDPVQINSDLTIDLGGKLNANELTISLKGNWTNNGGTFTPGTNTGTVIFNGSGIQTITATAGETFNNFTSNTTGPIELDYSSSATINNTLTMTSGNFNLNERTLTLGNGFANTLSRTSGIIYNGNFKRYIPTVAVSSTVAPLYGLFPVGTSTEYRPLELNSAVPTTGGGYVTVWHTDNSGSTDVTYTDFDGDAIQRVSGMKTSISTSGGFAGGDFSVKVSMTGLSATGVLSDLKMISYTGGVPDSDGPSIATTGTVSAPTVGRSGYSDIELPNDYVVCSKNSATTPMRQYFYSIKSGNWSDITLWSNTDGGPTCNSVPSNNAYAVICTGHLVSVDAAISAGTVDFIDIRNGAVLNGTFSLVVGKDLTTYGNGIFAPASGSWTVSRNTILTGTGTSSFAGVSSTVGLNIGEFNTLTLGNNLTVSGDINIDGTLGIGINTLNLSGSGNISGSTGAAEITYSGAGQARISSNRSIIAGSNIIINPPVFINGAYTVTNNGTVSLISDLTCNNTNAKWTNATGSVLYAGGSILSSGTSGKLEASASPNTVEYNFAGDQNVKVPLSTYFNLILSNSGNKTFATAGTITIGNLLTIKDAAVFNTASNTLNGVGGLNMSGTSELIVGRIATVPELSGSYNITGGTITMNGAGNQTVRSLSASPSAYYNLELDGSGIKTLGGNIQILGDLSVGGTCQLDAGASNYTIDLDGDWTITSTSGDPFVERGGTVYFTGPGLQTISTVLAAGESFYNISMSNTVGLKLLNKINVGYDLTIEPGAVFNANSNDVFIYHNWVDNGGTYQPGSNTVDFNGVNQLISAPALSTFNNITFSNSGTKTLGCNLAILSDLIIEDAAAFDVGTANYLISIAGDWTVTSSVANPFVERYGSVTFNGTGWQFITTSLAAGETFYNFIISNNTSGIKLNDPIVVTADLTINSGAFLNANDQNITIAGNWINNAGNFVPTTGRVIFNGTAPQTITKTTGEIFYNFTSACVGPIIIEGSSSVKITNNLTLTAGNFNLNGRTLTLGNLSVASLSRASGTIYGGTFSRYLGTAEDITSNSGSFYGLFPVGSSTEYRPVELNSSVRPTVAGYVSVVHTDATTVVDVTFTMDGEPIQRVAEMKSTISTSGGFAGGTYSVHATMTSLSTIGSLTDLKLLTYNDFSPGMIGSPLATSGTVSSPRVGRSNVAAIEIDNKDLVVGSKNMAATPLKQYYYSRTSSNWSNNDAVNGTWSLESGGAGAPCGCTPSANGYVIISSGHTVTLDVIASADYIDIETGASLIGTTNLTINKDITTFGTGAFNPTSGLWSITRNMVLGGGSSSLSGTATISGSLNISSTATLTMNGGVGITVSGDITVDGTLALGNSTLTLNGINKNISGSGGAALISGTGAVDISTGNKNISAGSTLTIQPTFSITGARTVNNYGTVTLTGNLTGTLATSVWTNNSSSVLNVAGSLLTTGQLNASSTPNTVNYNGAGNQLIKMPASTYHTLYVSTSGTKTFATTGTISVTSMLTVQDAAILDAESNTINGSGGLTMSGTAEFKLKKAAILPELNGPYTINGGTIELYNNGDQGIKSLNSGSSAYYNLKLSGSGYKTLDGNITVQKNILIDGTCLLDVSVSNYNINLGGNWTVTSVNANPFIERSGTVLCNGSTSQTISTILAGGETFYNLSISNTTGVLLSNTTNIKNDFTINSGSIFDAQSNNINIEGDWINNGGTFTAGTNTVNFKGSGVQYLTKASGESFNNLTISQSSSTILGGPVTIQGNLLIDNTASFDVAPASFALNISGTWTVSSTNADPFVENNGTVTFNGNVLQTISTVLLGGETFYNFINNNITNGVLLSNAVNILGDFTINTGAIFIADGNSMSIGKNWSNAGTFTHGNNTVTFNGSGPQTITNSAGEVFSTLISNTTGPVAFESSTDVTINTSFTMTSGNFNLNGRTLTLGSISAATLIRTTGVLYGGYFRRFLQSGVGITSNSGNYYGLFPIGTASDYRPIELNSSGSPTSSGYLTASHTDIIGVTDISFTETGPEFDAISRITNMYSTLSKSGGFGGGTYDLNVTMTSLSTLGSVADLKMITNTGGVPASAGTTIATSGTVSSPKVGRSGLTDVNLANDFVVGTKDASNTPIMQYYYSRKTGDWNDIDAGNGTWSLTYGGPSCGCMPGANSYAMISTGHTVTVTTNSAVEYVSIETGAILNGTANLTISKDLTTAGTGVFNPASGTWSVGRDLTLVGSGSSSFTSAVSIGRHLSVGAGTTLSAGGDMVVTGNLNVDGTLALGTYGLTLNGSGTTISGSTGAHSISGTGTISVTTGNKTINAGTNLNISPVLAIVGVRTVSNNGTITLANNLTGSVANSKWVNENGSVLNITGSLLTNGILDASSSNTVNYNGGGAQSVKIPMASYYNLTLSNAGTKSFSTSPATITVSNMVTIQDAAVFDVSDNTLNGSAGLSMSGTAQLWLGKSTTVPELSGAYSLISGSIVLNGTADQSIRSLTAAPSAYYNLTLSGSGTKTLAGQVSVQNNLLISGSAILDVSSSSYALNVGGNWNVTSVAADPFVEQLGTVTFNGSSTQNLSTVVASGEQFYNLIINNSSTNGVILNDPIKLVSPSSTGNSITLNSGSVFNVNNYDVYLHGNWIDNGATFTPGTAKVIFNGSGAQSITKTGTITFNNVEFTNSGTTTLGCNISVKNIEISGTATLDVSASNYSLSVLGDWTVTSPIGNPFIEQQGTVTFAGTAAQTISTVLAEGETFYRLTVNNTNVTGVQLGAILNVSNTLTLNAASKFRSNNYNINISGNWTNSGGTFYPGTGTVAFIGLGAQTITKASLETFYNLTINSIGPITISSSVAAPSPAIAITGTLTMTNGNVNLNGRYLRLGNGAIANLVWTDGILYGGYFQRYIALGTTITSNSGSYFGLFPVGTSTDHRSVEINTNLNVPTSNGYIAVRHVDATTIPDVSLTDCLGEVILRIADQYSQVITSLTDGTYDIYASFSQLALSGNLADLRLTTVASPYCVGAHQVADGLINAPRAKRTGLTAANLNNTFKLGTKDPELTPLRRFYYSRKTGNWNDATADNATWSYQSSAPQTSCDCVPATNGYVVIQSGHTVSVTGVTTAAYVDINDGGTLNGNNNFTVSKHITTAGTGLFNFTAGNWSVGGNMTLAGTGSSAINGTLTITGNLNVGNGTSLTKNGAGSINISSDLTVNGTFNITGSQLNLNGSGKNISGTGSILASSTAIILNASQNQNIIAGSNLTITPRFHVASGKVLTNNGTVTCLGNVTGVAGATPSKWINANGSLLNAAGSVMTSGNLEAHAVNTINYNALGAQTIETPIAGYYNLVLSGSGVKSYTVAGTIVVSNRVTIEDDAVFDISTNTLNGTAGLTMIENAEFRLAKLTTNLPELTGEYSLSSGTVTFNGAGSQSVRSLNSAPSAYYKLNIAGSGTKTLTGSTVVQSDLTIAGTSALDVSASNYSLNVGGNWTVSSTNVNPFVEQNGTVTFDGTLISQTITAGPTPNAETFYNLVVSNPVDVTFMDVVNCNNLTINSNKVLNANGFAFNVAGNWSNLGGTFNSNLNTVTFNGTNQSISKPTTENFYVVVFGNTGTKTLACNIDAGSNLIISGTAALDVSASNYSIGVSGNWSSTSGNVDPFNERSGTVTFNGTSGTTLSTSIAYESFYNLVINNTSAAGLLLNDEIRLSSNITINAGAKLDGNNKNVSVAGNWTNNGGSYIPGTGTVTFNGTSTQTITNTTGETFYNFISNTTGPVTLESNSDLAVTNSLTMTSGSYNLNGRTLTLGNGAANSLIRNSGTLYGGTFSRFIPTGTAITSTNGNFYGLFPVGSSSAYRPFEINTFAVAPTSGGFVSVIHNDAYSITNITYTDNELDNIQRITDMNTTVTTSGGFGGGDYIVSAQFSNLINAGLLTDIKLITNTAGTPGSAGAHIVATGTVDAPKVGRSNITDLDLANVFVAGTKSAAVTPLIQCYYSIASGNWNDGNNWSLTLEGPPCGCTPSNTGYAVIVGPDNITVNTNSQINYIDIMGGATLSGTANMLVNYEVNVLEDNGTFAPNSGNWTITRDLSLKGTNSNSHTSNGTTTVGRSVKVYSTNTLTLNGALTNSGSLQVDGDFSMGIGSLLMNGAGAQISGTGDILGAGIITLTGNKSILGGSLIGIEPTINLSTATTVANSGTINAIDITGTDATSKWVNAANSILNITGSVLSVGTLDASANPNVVNYNFAGDQVVKIPNPSYYNLSLSVSGIKTYNSAGNISVSNLVTIQNDAIFNVEGNRLIGTGGLTMTDNSELQFAYNSVVTAVPELTGVYTLSGGTVTFNDAGNQLIRGLDVTAAYFNLNIQNDGVKYLGGNVSVSNNLTIGGNAQLDASASNYSIKLSGDWSVTSADSDPFVERSGTVTFNGTSIQSIASVLAAGETFNGLIINNTSALDEGINLGSPVNVSGTLNLTQGIVNTTLTNILALNSGATSNLGSGSPTWSFVNGPMINRVATIAQTNMIFPLGIVTTAKAVTGTSWRPTEKKVRQSAPSNVNYTAELVESSAADLDPTNTMPAGIDHVSRVRHYTLDRDNIANGLIDSEYSIYYMTDNGKNDFVDDEANLSIAQFDGTTWYDIGSGSYTRTGSAFDAGSGSTFYAGKITSAVSVLDLFPASFSLAAKTTANPLPIDLLAFTGQLKNKVVDLYWSTLSEVNNDYFTIEKSSDGLYFEELFRVSSQGNSNTLKEYYGVDKEPFIGNNYYRIKQTDFNGKFKYSKIISVYYSISEDMSFNVFPNPVRHNDKINISISGVDSEKHVLIVVQDILGKSLYSKVYVTSDCKDCIFAIDPQNNIPPGIYIITGTSDNKIFNRRIVIK